MSPLFGEGSGITAARPGRSKAWQKGDEVSGRRREAGRFAGQLRRGARQACAGSGRVCLQELTRYRDRKMTAMDRFRRLLGLVFLGGAGVLTIIGLTWLAPFLHGVGYLVFWLIPIGAAMGALVCAVIDLRVVRRRYEAERLGLAREVFGRRAAGGDGG